MIEVSADITVPVGRDEAYDVLTDLEHATWLPGVRRLRHIGGPVRGQGARYEVEANLIGRQLNGVLACSEAVAPLRTVMTLEDGLDLSITGSVEPSGRGSHVILAARYSVGTGLAARAVERASAGAARREVQHALARFGARWDRTAPSAGE